MVKDVLGRLNPSGWPLRINDFPDGSALVGGAIRDALIGRSSSRIDLDFVVPQKAIKIAEVFAKKSHGKCVVLDEDRDIARLVLGDWTIDIASQVGASLEEDLLRRDFRLNAIAITFVNDLKIIDPTDGIRDICDKKLVAVSEQNLIDDPLRLLRGIRLLAQLGFDMDSQTKRFINTHAGLLVKSAPERIQGELHHLALIPEAEEVFPFLLQTGLLKAWENEEFPLESHLFKLSNAKTFSSDEFSLALPLLRLTTLLSDEGLKKLRFSKTFRENCYLLRKWQKRYDGKAFQTLSEADRFQLHKELEHCLPALIFTLSLPYQLVWLERWRNFNDPLFHPCFPIDGNSLKTSLGLASGPLLGRLLDFLSQENAFGRLEKKDQIIELARFWIQQNQTLL